MIVNQVNDQMTGVVKMMEDHLTNCEKDHIVLSDQGSSMARLNAKAIR